MLVVEMYFLVAILEKTLDVRSTNVVLPEV